MSEWYYTANGQQQGPVSLEQLQQMLQSGAADLASTQVWRAGFEQWVPANQVPELTSPAPGVAAPTSGQPEAPVTEAQVSNPYAAPSVSAPLQATEPGEFEIPEIPTPPTVGDAISAGFRLIKARMGLLVGVAAVYMILGFVFSLATGYLAVAIDGPGALGQEAQFNFINGDFTQIQEQQEPSYGPGYWIHQIAGQLMSAFLVLGISAVYLNLLRGRPADISDLFSQGSKVLKCFLCTLLYGLILLPAFLLLIVPGVWLSLRLSMYALAIVEKDLGPIEALKYSFRLTRSSALPLLGIGFVSFWILMAGAICCLVGLLWAIPIVGIAWTYAFVHMHGGPHQIIEETPQV